MYKYWYLEVHNLSPVQRRKIQSGIMNVRLRYNQYNVYSGNSVPNRNVLVLEHTTIRHILTQQRLHKAVLIKSQDILYTNI
jgi:hypothetical protein